MGLTDEETKEIKVLSRAGNFQLIREKYGDKWEANARKWLERKGLAGGAQESHSREEKGGAGAEDEDDTAAQQAPKKTIKALKPLATALADVSIISINDDAADTATTHTEDAGDADVSTATVEAAAAHAATIDSHDTNTEEQGAAKPAEVTKKMKKLGMIVATGDGDGALGSGATESGDAGAGAGAVAEGSASNPADSTPAKPAAKKFAGLKPAMKPLVPKMKSSSAAAADGAGDEASEGGGGAGAGEEGEGGEDKPVKVKKPRKSKAPVPATADASVDGAPATVLKVKRAPTAYLLFSTDHRAEVLAANPGLPFAEVGKKLGEMWAAADADTKAAYQAKHEAQKAALAAEGPVAVPVLQKKAKKAKPAAAAEAPEAAEAGSADAEGDAEMQGSSTASVKKLKPLLMMKPSNDTKPKASKVEKEAKKAAAKAERDAAAAEKQQAKAPAKAPSTAKPSRKRRRDDGEVEYADDMSDDERGDDSDSGDEKGSDEAGVPAASGRRARKHKEPQVDESEIIRVYDPRAELMEQIAKKKAAGDKRVDVNLPHLTGSMNYRPYLCNEEDQVALVLPALADWRKSLELAAANVAAAASGQLAVDDDDAVQMAKQADAHKLMSLLEANGFVTPLQPHYGLTKSGTLFGTVEKMERLEDVVLAASGKASTGGSAGAAAASAEGPAPGAVAVAKLLGLRLPGTSAADDDDDDALSQSDGGSSLAGSQASIPLSLSFSARDMLNRSSSSIMSRRSVAPRRSDTARRGKAAWHIVSMRLHPTATAEGGFPEEEEDEDEEGSAAEGGEGRDQLKLTMPKAPPAGPMVKFAWLPPHHPVVATPFLLQAHEYSASLKRDLRPGSQMRAMFSMPGNAWKGEWLEGRVYHCGPRKADVAAGWPQSKYMSLSVVWYEQDAWDLSWVVDDVQTENTLSPWEAVTDRSPFVRLENVHAYCMELDDMTTALDVVTYLCTTEPAAAFMKPVNAKEAPGYYARIKNPVDLGAIKKKAEDGGYDEPAAASSTSGGVAGAGMRGLWEDLRTLIKNAKVFNAPDTNYWRLADMLECEVRRVKKACKATASTTSSSGAAASSSQSQARSGGGLRGGAGAAAALLQDSDLWFGSQDDISGEAEAEEYGGGSGGSGGSAGGAGRRVGGLIPATLRSTVALAADLLTDLDADGDDAMLSQGSTGGGAGGGSSTLLNLGKRAGKSALRASDSPFLMPPPPPKGPAASGSQPPASKRARLSQQQQSQEDLLALDMED